MQATRLKIRVKLTLGERLASLSQVYMPVRARSNGTAAGDCTLRLKVSPVVPMHRESRRIAAVALESYCGLLQARQSRLAGHFGAQDEAQQYPFSAYSHVDLHLFAGLCALCCRRLRHPVRKFCNGPKELKEKEFNHKAAGKAFNPSHRLKGGLRALPDSQIRRNEDAPDRPQR